MTPLRRQVPGSGPSDGPAERVLAGRAWVGGRLQPVEVGIDAEGRISAVRRSVSGGRRHDVGDRVLLPAATDPHVHFREPGPDGSGESIATGTVGAALGGVGLVGEMPNTEPPTTTVERIEEKEDRLRGRAAVDLLLYAMPLDPRQVPGLARRAGGFKLYLSPTTGVDTPPSVAALGPMLEALARTDLVVAAHAEDPARFHDLEAPDSPLSWNLARPPEAEAGAVERLLLGPDRLRLHVAHVTTAGIARSVRRRGASFEATAHHLLLSTASGRDGRWKVNPPLRPEPERALLWREFRDGRVPILASDHAPHPRERKALPFPLAPSGVPGVETTLPLLLARVASAELGLDVLLRAACDRPARLLGQPMGRLSVGHRAHLLVVDFRRRTPIRADRLRSPCGWSPFEGAEAVFPVEHWRDGEPIVEDGEYVGRPSGRTVRPEYADRSEMTEAGA